MGKSENIIGGYDRRVAERHTLVAGVTQRRRTTYADVRVVTTEHIGVR